MINLGTHRPIRIWEIILPCPRNGNAKVKLITSNVCKLFDSTRQHINERIAGVKRKRENIKVVVVLVRRECRGYGVGSKVSLLVYPGRLD